MKIEIGHFYDYRVEKAQQSLKSRSLLKKILTVIQDFFGMLEGSILQRTLAKSKFYGKNLQSYKYEETLLTLLKNFFVSKNERQNTAIQKENVFKEKIFKNLAFIKTEAANCKAALSSSSGDVEVDVKSESDLVEMIERCEELKIASDQLSNEIKMFPELVFGISRLKYTQLKSDIVEVYSDLQAIRDSCSERFSDLIYEEMKINLEELKSAESPEEKQTVKEKMIQTELYAQSKAFLLNERDLKFINSVINVSDYLINLDPKSGLMDFDNLLAEIIRLAVDEIRNGPLDELNEIEDLDILQRAVFQLDGRINKLVLQMEFTSDLMEEDTYLNYLDLIKSLSGDINEYLEKVISDKEEAILFRMNAFNSIENSNTIQVRDQFFKLKREIVSEIDQLQKFIEFLGADFVRVYSGSMQLLRDDIVYKEWLIQNSILTYFDKNTSELLFEVDKYQPNADHLMDAAVEEVLSPLEDRMDSELDQYFAEFEAIKAKIESWHTISDTEKLTDELDEVKYSVIALYYSLQEAICEDEIAGKEVSPILNDFLNDVQIVVDLLNELEQGSNHMDILLTDQSDGTLKPDLIADLEEVPDPIANLEKNPIFFTTALKDLNDSSVDFKVQSNDENFRDLMELMETNLKTYLDS